MVKRSLRKDILCPCCGLLNLELHTSVKPLTEKADDANSPSNTTCIALCVGGVKGEERWKQSEEVGGGWRVKIDPREQ